MARKAIGNEEQMAKVKAQVAKASAINNGGAHTHTEIFEFTAESGKLYTGNFVFKRPAIKDFITMGGVKAKYLRDAGVTGDDIAMVDSSVRYLAHVLSVLKTITTEAPEWFNKVDQLKDADVIYELYDMYQKWESSFRPKTTTTGDEGDSENAEPEETVED